jgi:uncharacterized membrane protein YgaE (UPF0421/DUF939 family)
MIENSIIKSVGLLITITVGVLIGTYGITVFFWRDKELRKFWLKVWLAIVGVISLAFWIILIFWENEHFK